MTRLLALLPTLLAPIAARLRSAHIRTLVESVVRRSTQVADQVKPAADQLLADLVEHGRRSRPHVHAWRSATSAVVHAWAAAAVHRDAVPPLVAPELAAHASNGARVRLVHAPGFRHAARTTNRWLDHVELRFLHRWPAPGHARLAAGVFTTSVALTFAGVAGAVAAVAPGPIVGDPPAAVAASETPTTGPAVEAASAPPPAPVPGAPAPSPSPGKPATPAPASPGAPAAAATPFPAATVVPASRGALPIGKGMWIWLYDQAEGGDAAAIVNRAKLWGFSHLYVRTGTLREGFIGGPFLDRLLPIAHANGIRVYGWDFPYMERPGDDVNRALAAIRHTTPDGHRIDGFAPDIETKFEGTNENLEFVTAYVSWLRQNVGADYPLIAVVPNPTTGRIARGYPYAQILGPFDAVAPMVYWMNRDPGADVVNAITYLSQFGKPIFPVGQAYDGAIDGGPPGVPNRDAILRFMQHADAAGAAGVSFWSWQHATQEAWNAISDAMEFRLEPGPPEALRGPMIRAYQVQLTQLGFPAAPTGAWTPETAQAVKAFQKARDLPETGIVDGPTRDALLRPIPPTIRPAGH